MLVSFGRQLARGKVCRRLSTYKNTVSEMYGGGGNQGDDYGGGRPYRGGRRYYGGGRGGGRGGRGARNRDMGRPDSTTSEHGRDQGYQQRRDNWRDGRDDGQNDFNEQGQNGDRMRPPPGLKGREIGLFYARRGKVRREQMEKERRPEVKFEGMQEQNIRRLLHDLQSTRDCPPQPSRSFADLPDDSEDMAEVAGASHGKMEQVDGSKRETAENTEGSSQYDSWSDSIDTRVKPQQDDSKHKHNTVIKSKNDQKFEMKVKRSVESTSSYGYNDDYDEDGSGIIDVMKVQVEEDYLGNDVREVTFPGHLQNMDTSELDETLYKDFMSKQDNRTYQDMMKFRQKLPSYDHRQTITELISENQVVVLSGETGCGKTTQVPQFILDDFLQRKQGTQCRIICTQPRRISAISVAERVAAERAESCGKSAGYLIRLENKLPRTEGSILYCTTGILLKVLEDDPLLGKATHIILDEIHERDLLSDFLIIILRDVLAKRPDLKVVLMSATLNAKAFSEYFDNCPMYNIPGFTYPVTEFYLEDTIELLQYNIPDNMHVGNQPRRGKKRHEQNEEREELDGWIQAMQRSPDKQYSRATCNALRNMDMEKIDLEMVRELIKYIVTDKHGTDAILVFLPGWNEISNLHKILTNDRFFTSDYFTIIPLHSMMPTINQKQVFERPAHGVKIVIATNIAETSITIDDVVYVIDCGRIKVKGYSPENNLSSLNSTLVSLANARQRRGRAGRVQAGECYHLYTRLQESKMLDYLPPEMLRTRLEELCLQIKYLKLGSIVPFVSKALEPPSMEALNTAIVNLQRLNALDGEENLLPLGKHLARMPLDPHTGKMILFGAMFGCLDPILTIAACLNFKDPFFSPLGKEQLVDQRKQILAENCLSDHLLLVKTYNQWERSLWRGTNRDFCHRNFLSESTLRMLQKMRKQLADVLKELGFLSESSPKQQQANENSGNQELVKSIVCAGLYPNIAKITKGKTKHSHLKLITEDSTKCQLHPKSVAKDLYDPVGQWIVYHMKMKTSGVFIYDLSVVSHYALLFFGGDITQVQDSGVQTVCVDDWIRFKASPNVVSLVKDLRKEMDMILESKISHTKGTNWGSSEGAIIRAIIDLITMQDDEKGATCQERR